MIVARISVIRRAKITDIHATILMGGEPRGVPSSRAVTGRSGEPCTLANTRTNFSRVIQRLWQ